MVIQRGGKQGRNKLLYLFPPHRKNSKKRGGKGRKKERARGWGGLRGGEINKKKKKCFL